MKRNVILSVVFVFVSILTTYGQGEMGAFKASRNDLTGTARGMGMASAFGALGADLTGVKVNPGGIGMYRSSEIVATMNLSSTKINTNTLGSELNDSRTKFNFDNIAYIGYMPMAGSTIKAFNFGFAYNRLKNFDRNYQAQSYGQGASLMDYIQVMTSGYEESALSFDYGDPYKRSEAPWLSILGYQATLINPAGNSGKEYAARFPGVPFSNFLSVEERGAIDSYELTGGMNISDMLYLGATFSFTDMDYTYLSHYSEDFDGNNGSYDLYNDLHTEGSGYQVSVGAIFQPVNAFRIGVAYHSPTWYDMSDYYNGNIQTSFTDEKGDYWAPDEDTGRTPYQLYTPYRWVFSAAGIIGTSAVVSLDYEIADYSSIGLRDEYGRALSWDPEGAFIEQDFKMASTLKVGIEVRATPRLSLRAGYAWMQSPLETNFREGNLWVETEGTIPHFTLEGDANLFSVGLGYRITKGFYMDVAFVYKTQTDDLYAFSKSVDEGYYLDYSSSEFKSNTYRGMLTLGYKF